MSEKVFVVLRGLPGSGKSDFASLIASWGHGLVFTTDDYWDEVALCPFNARQLAAAHRWNQDRVVQAFLDGKPLVILANTSARKWEFEGLVSEARFFGYKVIVSIVENYHDGNNIHNVPEETISHMERKFELQIYRQLRQINIPRPWGCFRRRIKKP